MSGEDAPVYNCRVGDKMEEMVLLSTYKQAIKQAEFDGYVDCANTWLGNSTKTDAVAQKRKELGL